MTAALEAVLDAPSLILPALGKGATFPRLSASQPVAEFLCGDFTATYLLDERTFSVGLRLLPLVKKGRVVEPRKYLETPEILALPAYIQPVLASHGETSLVQLKLAEDDSGGAFSGGRSMRFNPTVEGLRFVSQSVEELPEGGFTISTVLRGARPFLVTHMLQYRARDEAITVHAEFDNIGPAKLTLEMLSSFAIGGLSPFDREDSRERLRVHRFRSLWSSEGRHEAVDLEDLHLERSWGSSSVVNERFGQVGSMPVRGFFPFVAIEDVKEGVFWGAQLSCASSWQIEVYRKDDSISLSGGLADRELGHWMKTIAPGEKFITPSAFLSAHSGHLDAFCQRMTRMQTAPLAGGPEIETKLPIIFNEWCSTWGAPTPEHIRETSERLRELPVRIFVIDDGWAEKPPGAAQFNGDWIVERRRFPQGLAPVTAVLRQQGFIPGLWFEFEVCTEGTEAFKLTDHKLKRDGRTLKVGTRHFWDFTDPWTFEYLTEKVIRRLRDDHFGYLKVDYNDTVGLGCDDADSLGEGLRKHVAGVRRFFAQLRAEIPGLIIEMCSSGGHRLEPSMLSLAAMGSFSDAHESVDIPVIAANLHRLILPRQSQIWAVLHAQDDERRLLYSLAACFLGRLCLSGEIAALSADRFEFIKKVLHFYEEVVPIIRDGETRLYRDMNKSYRTPQGWQVVVRQARSGSNDVLVVAHAFGRSAGRQFEAPLPAGQWTLVNETERGLSASQGGNGALHFTVGEEFSAYVGHFTDLR